MCGGYGRNLYVTFDGLAYSYDAGNCTYKAYSDGIHKLSVRMAACDNAPTCKKVRLCIVLHFST